MASVVQFPDHTAPEQYEEVDGLGASRGILNAVPLSILLWAGILWLIVRLAG